MKSTMKTRLLALLICAAMLIGCVPLTAYAEDAGTTIEMTEGDVITGFAEAGAECTSSDPCKYDPPSLRRYGRHPRRIYDQS